MVFLLDTNAISDLMQERPFAVGWLKNLNPTEQISTCVIVRGEIPLGIARLAPGRRQRDLLLKAENLFAALSCEPVPTIAAEHYAAIKSSQQIRGLSLDENDFWIAATALARSCTLVTRDEDFSRLENLSVINWTQK